MLSTAWLLGAGFVLTRMAACIAVMPTFSTTGIPPLTRVLLALALTGLIAPVVPMPEGSFTLSAVFAGMFSEFLLGTLMGGTVRLAFSVINVAGEAISVQVGHGAAMMFDPTMMVSQAPLGTLSGLLAGLVFLGTNLHLVLLNAVSESFHLIPPGGIASPVLASAAWVPMTVELISVGISLSGPILTLVFLINLFVAVITRLAPSMNVFFSLGMILTVVGGQALFFVTLPLMLDVTLDLVEESIELLPMVLELAARPS